MSSRHRRTVRFVTSVLVLCLTGGLALAGPARADDDLSSGGKPPAGWTVGPEAYASIFGGVGEGAPQGSVVADSGFRPYPHGFPLPNWGSPTDFAQNALIYGTPERVTLPGFAAGDYAAPASLNSLALRRTLGDGVCRDRRDIDPRTGGCELILGARLLAQMIETAALGGHCFGFAAAAAALYNGQLPANQVGASGLGINAANPMGNAAVQTITRLFGTQYLNPDVLPAAAEGRSPTAVVEELIQQLPSGTVPFVLTVIGPGGGHAITPYAVLDRGDGLYDIAVYDNNFPLRALALTVDTTADTFLYTSATNPNAPGYTWSTQNDSVVDLVPVSGLLAKQPCPVCRGANDGTLLAFNSRLAANEDSIAVTLTDRAGRPLPPDDYRVLDVLNPPTKSRRSAPLIVVDEGVDFVVQVRTSGLRRPQPVEVYALRGGTSHYLLMQDVPPTGRFAFGVTDTGSTFQSGTTASPRIEQVWDGPRQSVDVNGHPLALPRGATVHQSWDRAAGRVTFRSTARRALDWNIQTTQVLPGADAGWVALGARVPAGARVVVEYAGASHTMPPRAWVVTRDGSRTSLTMLAITPDLVASHRHEVYTLEGPG